VVLEDLRDLLDPSALALLLQRVPADHWGQSILRGPLGQLGQEFLEVRWSQPAPIYPNIQWHWAADDRYCWAAC